MPHPRTHLIESLVRLASLPASDFQGAILKPLSSVDFSSKYGVKGFVVDSQNQALRLMADLEFPIMLQEFIPGPPTAGYFLDGFVDRTGKICGMFARQRLRMSPPKLGNSTLMVSVRLDEVAEAEKSLTRLLGPCSTAEHSVRSSNETSEMANSNSLRSMPVPGGTSNSRRVAAWTSAPWPIKMHWGNQSKPYKNMRWAGVAYFL